MLRRVLAVGIFLVVVIAGGAASVLFALETFNGAGTIAIGPWTTSPSFGTPSADPYAKARFAREGGLALGQAEGISFTAQRDSAGRPLRAECTYTFEGLVPPARFWTLRASDPADRLLPGIGRRVPALQSLALLRGAEDGVTVAVGPMPSPGNWLAVAAKGPMRLVLTLYDTPIAGEAGVMDVELPTIARGTCG